MRPPRLPFYYGWVVVAVAFVTVGLGVNARTAFSLLFPPVLDEFGWDRGLTAGAFSFGFLVSAVLSPLLGRVMDRRGPRIVIEAGVGFMAAGLLLATLVSAPWHLYVTLGLLVGGGSICLGYTAHALFLPNWFVRQRGLAMSVAFSGVGVGSIVLLPWLAAIIERAGWRAACAALGVLVLVVLVPLNVLVRGRPQALGLEPDGDRRPPHEAAVLRAANVVDAEWVQVEWTLGRAACTARFWWIAVGYFLGLYCWYAVQVHQTKYLVEIGFGPALAAWALGLVSLAAIPGQIALGHLSDRIGREWVWMAGSLGFALCYLALLLLRQAPTPLLLWVMVLSQGMLGYGLTSVIGAIPVEIFEGQHYGTIFGTLMLASIAGGAAGPWVTGAVHDATGSYTAAWWIAIGASALSALAIWLAAPRKVRAVRGRVECFIVAVTLGFIAVASLATAQPGTSIFQGTLLEPNQQTLEVSTEELKKILADRQRLVIDARPFVEYAVSHVPGAVNVSAKPTVPMSLYVSDVREIERLVAGDKTKSLVLYCNGPYCGKSKRLSEERLGADTSVRRYQLGMPVWRTLGGLTQIELEGIKYVHSSDRTAVFLDARDPGEFGVGSVSGARNLPATGLAAGKDVSEVKQARDDGRLPMEDHNTRRVFGRDGAQAQLVAEVLVHEAFQGQAIPPRPSQPRR